MNFKILLTIILFFLAMHASFAQFKRTKAPDFWDNVRYGGGLSFNFGNNFFSGAVSPSAIYDFNRYFSAGPSLNFSYLQINERESYVYGGSIIGLFNPIRQLQVSAEFQESRVENYIEQDGMNYEERYWYPSLFLGIGYSARNVTFGIRYDVLYDDDKSVYAQPYAPFVRVYF